MADSCRVLQQQRGLSRWNPTRGRGETAWNSHIGQTWNTSHIIGKKLARTGSLHCSKQSVACSSNSKFDPGTIQARQYMFMFAMRGFAIGRGNTEAKGISQQQEAQGKLHAGGEKKT
jgi:hypothetical protein